MPDLDLVFRNATLIDGTGAPARRGDLAVHAGRIAAVGTVPPGAARETVDLAGQALAPGFIDVHTHDDRALLANPAMAMKASQGVTTVVVGNCGVSLAPIRFEDRDPPPPMNLLGGRAEFRYGRFAEYLAALDAAPASINAACLVGHSTLRIRTMPTLDRGATADEIAEMKTLLGEALDAGAVGMSTGLYYVPAQAAPPAEIEALAALLRPAGAVYTSHMRDEGDHVLDSLEETFALGRHAGVPVIVSHHKVAGRGNFGRMKETLPKIAEAQARQHVGLDAYPYPAGSTVLRKVMFDRADKTLITWSEPHPEAKGRYLADLADEWGVALDEAADRLQPAGAIYFMMDEADVRRVLAFPSTMIGSDGLPHDAHPHPRLWGTFPRVLGHYARDVGLFPLEEAVRKMTSLPAAEFGLATRGRLAEGCAADLVVFDPATVIDRATFEHPTEPAAGIAMVLVAGTPIWRDGAATGHRPGAALRRGRA
jgi:N-acyl-D-amino-acid deacylase